MNRVLYDESLLRPTSTVSDNPSVPKRLLHPLPVALVPTQACPTAHRYVADGVCLLVGWSQGFAITVASESVL